MTRFLLRGSISQKTLVAAAFLLACGWVLTPVALGQRVRGPVGGGQASGGGRMAPPRVVPPRVIPPPIFHPTISGPRVSAAPRIMGAGVRGFGFRQRPVNLLRRRLFFNPAFLRFGASLRFNPVWWPNCGPLLGSGLGWGWGPGWGWGYDCYAVPFYGTGFENYVTYQPFEVPVYEYVPEGQELVWLYLKDGTTYNVSDYWFVKDDVHFIAVEEGGAKSEERVIGLDELDVQKTIDVNTRRGFRVVMRDEPLQQYLRDHPDLTPPLLQPQAKN